MFLLIQRMVSILLYYAFIEVPEDLPLQIFVIRSFFLPLQDMPGKFYGFHTVKGKKRHQFLEIYLCVPRSFRARDMPRGAPVAPQKILHPSRTFCLVRNSKKNKRGLLAKFQYFYADMKFITSKNNFIEVANSRCLSSKSKKNLQILELVENF